MATALPAPCERTVPPGPAEPGAGGGRPLLATMLGTTMTFVVGSVINVALPAMQREFGVGADGAQLLINAYLLPVSALILLGGALGDRFGHRRLLVAGLALFALGTAACAVSPDFDLLIASRALEGIGASAVAPNSLGLIAEAYEAETRRRAVSLWATVGAASGAVAPVAGGWIVDVADWRWVFVAVVPPVAAALMLLYMGQPREAAAARAPRPIDAVGGVLISIVLAAIVYLLVDVPRSGANASAIVAGAMLTAASAGFLVTERRAGAGAVVPLAIFESRGFKAASLATTLLYGGLGALMVILPYMLIAVMGYSATAAGAAILPIPVAMVGLSRPMANWAGTLGTRRTLAIGAALVASGFALLAGSATPKMDFLSKLLPGLTVAGVGMAFSIGSLTPAVARSVRVQLAAAAANVNNATARIGGLVATAMLAPLLSTAGGAAGLVSGYRLTCWTGAGAAASAGIVALFYRAASPPDATSRGRRRARHGS